MTRQSLLLVILVLGSPVVGCEQKTDAPAPGGSAVAAVPVSDDDLAIASDFDDEAEQQITESSYRAEIDALEKDIGAEP